jgi:hypothetical protein
MAEAKIREAISMDEAMRWLSPKERMAVLAKPGLYALLDHLVPKEDGRKEARAREEEEARELG